MHESYDHHSSGYASVAPVTVPATGGIHPQQRSAADFAVAHAWLPAAALSMLAFVLLGLQGDQWIADRLYALQGHAWTLQSGFITQTLLHATARSASKVAWFGVLLLLMVSWRQRSLQGLRRPLVYLLMSTLLPVAIVGAMKRWTHVDCPWDLLRYGGDRTYRGVLEPASTGATAGACFPAGHASAGYAWVALYFFFRHCCPHRRWQGLGVGLVLGLVFGLTQQVRGAHFASHDLFALAVCWSTALLLYLWLLAPQPSGGGAGDAH